VNIEKFSAEHGNNRAETKDAQREPAQLEHKAVRLKQLQSTKDASLNRAHNYREELYRERRRLS
jgi:hypothetical protein